MVISSLFSFILLTLLVGTIFHRFYALSNCYYHQKTLQWKITNHNHKVFIFPSSYSPNPMLSPIYARLDKPNSYYYGKNDDESRISSYSALHKTKQSNHIYTLNSKFQRIYLKSSSIQKKLLIVYSVCFIFQFFSSIVYRTHLNTVLQRTGYARPQSILNIVIQWLGIKSPIVLIIGGKMKRSFGHVENYSCSILTSSFGPFTSDFLHHKYLSVLQPHRYITSGFIHASLLHLLFNIHALYSIPKWVEHGLGKELYTLTFMCSVIFGNISQTFIDGNNTICLGASSGICGLLGLAFGSLRHINNTCNINHILILIIKILGYGSVAPTISNRSNIVGLITGLIIEYLCGPMFRKSYRYRRKFSLSLDDIKDSSYCSVVGFGKVEVKRQIPWKKLGCVLVTMCSLMRNVRLIPNCLCLALLRPGLQSGMYMGTY